MESIVFERKFYSQMLDWKREKDGSTALLIQGARRVGKSTVAKEFARHEYKSHILVDFAEASKETKALFDDISDLDRLFFNLQFAYNKKLTPRQSVIIFDEIQFCPMARQAIRTLVKDHRYDYIETGSLLSVKQNTKGIRIPSEETRMTLYPMDYEEFRWAMGDKLSCAMVREAFAKETPLGNASMQKIMRDFRMYMMVGGMPQAVCKYISSNNLSQVDQVKREIIDLYADDFRKIDPTGNATMLFRSIPAQLAANSSRYTVSEVTDKPRGAKIEELLQDMTDSHAVLVSRHANDPTVGLALHSDPRRFKMYVNDTGLFTTMAFWDKAHTENEIYKKLISNKLSADLGYLYENMVAQMLTAGGNELYYHTWPTGSGKHYYEIDFLLSRGKKLCPLEVKSSNYRRHTSLDNFCTKYSDRVGIPYVIYTKDFAKEQGARLLPIFMTGLL